MGHLYQSENHFLHAMTQQLTPKKWSNFVCYNQIRIVNMKTLKRTHRQSFIKVVIWAWESQIWVFSSDQRVSLTSTTCLIWQFQVSIQKSQTLKVVCKIDKTLLISWKSNGSKNHPAWTRPHKLSPKFYDSNLCWPNEYLQGPHSQFTDKIRTFKISQTILRR